MNQIQENSLISKKYGSDCRDKSSSSQFFLPIRHKSMDSSSQTQETMLLICCLSLHARETPNPFRAFTYTTYPEYHTDSMIESVDEKFMSQIIDD